MYHHHICVLSKVTKQTHDNNPGFTYKQGPKAKTKALKALESSPYQHCVCLRVFFFKIKSPKLFVRVNYGFTLTGIYISFTFTAFGRSFYPEQHTEVFCSLHWKHIPILSSKNPVRAMLGSVHTSTKTVKFEGFLKFIFRYQLWLSICGINRLKY